MFYNTILSKFQSESVFSDCVFACGTVEMVIMPPTAVWGSSVLLKLVTVLKWMERIFFFCLCNLNSEGVYLYGNHKLRKTVFHFPLGFVF